MLYSICTFIFYIKETRANMYSTNTENQSVEKMTQPPMVIIGLLLCFVRITLLYWWTTGFVFFENSQYSVALSINFIPIQYILGLAFIDFLMVIGMWKNIKEFLYIWVATAIVNMVLVTQQLFFNLYQCYLGQRTHTSEEIYNITYWGLLMFSSISLLLVMEAINNLKTTTKGNCEDINEKGRRYSV